MESSAKTDCRFQPASSAPETVETLTKVEKAWRGVMTVESKSGQMRRVA